MDDIQCELLCQHVKGIDRETPDEIKAKDAGNMEQAFKEFKRPLGQPSDANGSTDV